MILLENSRLAALDWPKHTVGPVRAVLRSNSLPTFLDSELVSSADAASMAAWESKTAFRPAKAQRRFSLCGDTLGGLPGSSYTLHRQPVFQPLLKPWADKATDLHKTLRPYRNSSSGLSHEFHTVEVCSLISSSCSRTNDNRWLWVLILKQSFHQEKSTV